MRFGEKRSQKKNIVYIYECAHPSACNAEARFKFWFKFSEFPEAQDLKKRNGTWATWIPEETTSEQFVSMRIWGSENSDGQYTLRR